MTTIHRIPRFVAALLLSACALPAVTAAQSVPTIEPKLTRLYGSDSLDFGGSVGGMFGGAVSPDGHWLVTPNFERADRVNLWLVKIETGRAVRLTDGSYYDGSPEWFPTGDRIAFRTSRFAGPEQGAAHLALLAIDTVNGRAAGPPRQVTLEETDNWGFDISPDGRWLVYSAPVGDRSLPAFGREGGGMALRIMPAMGGTARTLTVRDRFNAPTWSPSGDSVYFTAPIVEGDAPVTTVFGISTSGGDARAVASWPSRTRVAIAPGARHLFRQREHGGEILTIDGVMVGRFDLPEKMTFAGFAGSELAILAYQQQTVAPVRIQPVMGGPARQLTEARAYDMPLGWAAGGEEVFLRTQLNGQDIFMLAPISGGALRQAPVPSGVDEFPCVLGDGTHVAYVKDDEQSRATVLTLVSLETGERSEVSRSIWDGMRSRGWLCHRGDFLFVEKNGERLDLKSLMPESPPRLLWSILESESPPMEGGLAVHGDRVAFTRAVGDSTTLYLTKRGQAAPRPVLTREGRMSLSGMWHPVWSPSGKLLVLPYMQRGATRTDAMVLEFDALESLVGEPRLLRSERGPKWWYATQWLPDESGFLALGLGAEGILDTEVWLFSLDPGVEPVPLTSDDPRSVWYFSLSPDGKYVAYSSEMPLGGSIWKVELEGVPGRR